jgi:hypothetical protein
MKIEISKKNEAGSTLAMSVLVIAILSGFVALAVNYTSNISRNAQRDRVFNNAVEIGDGCISEAFAAWRLACKNSNTQDPAISSFTPIPVPSSAYFPSFPAAVISNYKVEATSVLLEPYPSNSPPEKVLGPGSGTFSYFYLASVDVTLPAVSKLNGTDLKAKVRRVFEKRYTSPWNWAMLYNDNLELHPDDNLTLDGWVHSNANVYAGNGTSDASATPVSKLTFLDRLTYQGDYSVGYDPNDGAHSGFTNVAAPTTPASLPPGHEQFYSMFGWDTSKFNTTDNATNTDNDGYHELLEKPVTAYSSGGPTADPFKDQRMYNQAYNIADSNGNYGIVVNVDASNNVTMGYAGTTYSSQPSGNGSAKAVNWNAVMAAVQTNKTFQDGREGYSSGNPTIRAVNFDVAAFSAATTKNWNGILYVNDTSGSATTHRAVRIVNGSKLPTGGMTIVSPNPIYIQGDFNSGRTSSTEPPSNTGNTADPDVSGYTRQPASVMADSITLLSNNWNDSNSSNAVTSRVASNTTVNAALVAGNVPSSGSNYSGGGENFVRFLEDWTGKSFTYYGSMICPYASTQGTGIWGTGDYYRPPKQYWFFDDKLSVDSSGNPVTVPGYISTVAYLQQQRWYLQY